MRTSSKSRSRRKRDPGNGKHGESPESRKHLLAATTIAKVKGTKTEYNIPLHGVIYSESGWWFGHCLELDFVAEAKDPYLAMREMIQLCDLQIATAIKRGDLDSVFKPAPPAFWRMFAMAVEAHVRERKTGPVKRFETRELKFA